MKALRIVKNIGNDACNLHLRPQQSGCTCPRVDKVQLCTRPPGSRTGGQRSVTYTSSCSRPRRQSAPGTCPRCDTGWTGSRTRPPDRARR